jgi:hypothetical protein
MCEVGVVCETFEFVDPDGEGVAADGFAVEVVAAASSGESVTGSGGCGELITYLMTSRMLLLRAKFTAS